MWAERPQPQGSHTAHPGMVGRGPGHPCPVARLFLPFTWVLLERCRAPGCGREYSTTLPSEKATASKPSRLICGCCRMTHRLSPRLTISHQGRQDFSEGMDLRALGETKAAPQGLGSPSGSTLTFLAVVGGSQAPLGQNFMSQTQPWSAATA